MTDDQASYGDQAGYGDQASYGEKKTFLGFARASEHGACPRRPLGAREQDRILTMY